MSFINCYFDYCNDFKSSYKKLRTKCKMYIQHQRAISFLRYANLLQCNIGPTYIQTMFQRVTHSYAVRLNRKLIQPKCYKRASKCVKCYEGAKVL